MLVGKEPFATGSHRKGKVHLRCDKQEHTCLGSRKLTFLVPVNELLGLCLGMQLWEGLDHRASFTHIDWDPLPTPHCPLQLYLAPSLPASMTYSSKGSSARA